METKKRSLNFAAGPAKLPEQVLLKVQQELLNYNGLGISIMEMSHRSPHFVSLVQETENKVRTLLNVPNNYRILFLSGGATGQFAGIPLNLMVTGEADYVITGSWSAKAAKEATKYGKVNLVLPKIQKYLEIPSESSWNLSAKASYLYYCDNETIEGVEFDYVPQSSVPIVCDMSSNIFTRPIDVSKFGLIYACSQKNFSCSGVVLVIVRDDLLGQASSNCPSIWDYKVQNANKSLYNTPNTFSLYVMKLTLEWIEEMGGVNAMAELSQQKSRALYKIIDSSNGFYACPVKPEYRSRVNVPFRAGGPDGNEQIEKAFLEEAQKADLLELKGHRSVGGLRASLYNAVSVQDVDSLIKFMQEFQKNNSK